MEININNFTGTVLFEENRITMTTNELEVIYKKIASPTLKVKKSTDIQTDDRIYSDNAKNFNNSTKVWLTKNGIDYKFQSMVKASKALKIPYSKLRNAINGDKIKIHGFKIIK